MDDKIKELGGCELSPTDRRDLTLEGIAPLNIRYPKSMPAPFDLDWRLQGTNPWCVGFAAASLNQQAKARQKVNVVFDGEFIYSECKKVDGIPNLAGTYFRAGLQTLKNVGAKPVAGGDPAGYKIEEYASVPVDLEQIKIALSLYGGVLAAFELSSNGWEGDGSSHQVFPPKAGEATDRHATMLTRYDEQYLYGIDSLKNYHGGQDFREDFKNYKPFECWTITLDNKAVAGLVGWVASKYILGGTTIARLNLREEPNGKIIKVLPLGTKVDSIESVGDWLHVVVF
jgi:hypothetical protein